MIKCSYCKKLEDDYIESGQSICANCWNKRMQFYQRLEADAIRSLLANPPRMPIAPKQKKR